MFSRTVWSALAAAAFVAAAHAAQYTIIDAPGAKKTTLALDVNASGATTGWFLDGQKNYHGFVREPDGSYDTFAVDGEQTEGNAINDKGVVAGGYFPSDVGFLFGYVRTAKGKLKPFDPQPSNTVFIGGINNAGHIAGTFWDSDVRPHGYLRAKDGTFTTFDAPGKPNTEANAINADGVIAGNSFDDGNTAHGFVRATDGSFAQFDAPGAGQGGSAGTYVLAVNKGGKAVGYLKTSSFNEQAFVRAADGTITVFDAPGASQSTRGYDINKRGEIAGSFADNTGHTRGYVRAPSGEITTFDVPQMSFTQPLSINDAGVVVGYCKDKQGEHGFLRAP